MKNLGFKSTQETKLAQQNLKYSKAGFTLESDIEDLTSS